MEFIRIGESNLEVSEDGRIRNYKTKREYKKTLNKGGYLTIKRDVVKSHCKELDTGLVHRIVFIAYNYSEIEKIKDIKKYVVDHIDRDKENNNINNLRLVTYSTNSLNNERYSVKIAYNTKTEEIVITDNVRLFTDKYGVDNCNLWKVISGKALSADNWKMSKLENSNIENINFCISLSKEELSEDMIKAVEEMRQKKRNTNYVIRKPNDIILAKDNIGNINYLIKWSNRIHFCRDFRIRYKDLATMTTKNITHNNITFSDYDNNTPLLGEINTFYKDNVFNDYGVSQ